MYYIIMYVVYLHKDFSSLYKTLYTFGNYEQRFETFFLTVVHLIESRN